MKFLCDNCKAKYQIPDEKIAGRTLRMKCRKCSHEILIKGPKSGSSAGSKAAPRPRRSGSSASIKAAPRARGRSGSQAGPRPSVRKSGLGAEFRRSSLAPSEPPAARPATEWYVAINDVPVGPIRREEVARKIGTGAVTASSLCWREGFDDWRPVGQVPELQALLKQRRMPAPPSRPPAKAESSSVVPIGGRLGAAAAPSPDAFDDEDEKTVMAPAPAALLASAGAAVPAPAAAAKAVPKPTPKPTPTPAPAVAASAAPAAVEVAAPIADPFAPPPDPSPLAPPAAAPVAPAQTGGKRLPAGVWIAMAGAGCFGIALAVVIGPKLLADDPEPIAMNDVIDDPIEDPVEAEVELPIEPEVEVPVEEPEVDPGEEGTDPGEEAAETHATARSGMHSAPRMSSSAGTMTETSMLSAAEQAALARLTMAGTGGSDLGMLSGLRMGDSEGSSRRQALDEQAVRRVVTAASNQRGLQNCYNRAIRGMGDPPGVRLDVNVRVGASGAVTRVSARTDNNVGQIKQCVEQLVRRWRFPPSSGGGETAFPVVFSAG